MDVLGVLWRLMLVTLAIVALLNRPKFLIPPYAPKEPRILTRRLGAGRRR